MSGNAPDVQTLTNVTLNMSCSCGQELMDHSTMAAIAVYSLLIGVTIAGNSLVVLAFFNDLSLQAIANYWVVSLSLTDVTLAVTVMPMQVGRLSCGRWPLGPLGCDLFIALDVLSCTCSIYHLMLISLDRYLCVRFPFDYPSARTSRRTILAIVVTWCWCGLLASPRLLGSGTAPSSLVSFYIPLFLIMCMYIGIYRWTRGRMNKFKKRSRSMNMKGNKGTRASTRTHGGSAGLMKSVEIGQGCINNPNPIQTLPPNSTDLGAKQSIRSTVIPNNTTSEIVGKQPNDQPVDGSEYESGMNMHPICMHVEDDNSAELTSAVDIDLDDLDSSCFMRSPSFSISAISAGSSGTPRGSTGHTTGTGTNQGNKTRARGSGAKWKSKSKNSKSVDGNPRLSWVRKLTHHLMPPVRVSTNYGKAHLNCEDFGTVPSNGVVAVRQMDAEGTLIRSTDRPDLPDVEIRHVTPILTVRGSVASIKSPPLTTVTETLGKDTHSVDNDNTQDNNNDNDNLSECQIMQADDSSAAVNVDDSKLRPEQQNTRMSPSRLSVKSAIAAPQSNENEHRRISFNSCLPTYRNKPNAEEGDITFGDISDNQVKVRAASACAGIVDSDHNADLNVDDAQAKKQSDGNMAKEQSEPLRPRSESDVERMRRRATQKVLSKRRQVQENRTARIVVIVIGAFVALWAPFFFLNAFVPVMRLAGARSIDASEQVWRWVTLLGYVNSAINPFIYTYFNKTWRRAMSSVLRCQRKRHRWFVVGEGSLDCCQKY